ncbi:MAG: hypothetical protein IPJ81_07390 [Chitinophagaceae bacterium]|nr:hypothetical protein [Chitinophagaceae bacterium]
MKRIHLFEFEDLNWLPAFLRHYVTDFLQFMSNKLNIFKNIITIIEKGISKSSNNYIIDLASGSGGGWIGIEKELKKKNIEISILLTDFYPNIAAFKDIKEKSEHFNYIDYPVNAMNVPKTLKGLRTQFLSFHHFKPADAKKILQNAVDDKSPIAIFEAQERSFTSIMSMLFSPISVLAFTPFIKPFKLKRLIFTYVIPIVPFIVLWDGIVSSLRTYSIEEMNGLVSELEDTNSFEWETGRVKSGPGYVLYLLGYPKGK